MMSDSPKAIELLRDHHRPISVIQYVPHQRPYAHTFLISIQVYIEQHEMMYVIHDVCL